ncbi:MAG TPA: hypothetical protein VK817_10555 [Trebonia sp.]|jgi:hypothetical protein|nr:hypothetical protein [Trebonia sp.]
MSQPIGDCPGCGSDQPFEQIHPGACPDADGAECPEWACTACGAAVIMSTIQVAGETAETARQSVRAA